MSVSACGAHCLLPLHEFVHTIVHSYCNILNATIMLSLCVCGRYLFMCQLQFICLSVCLSVYQSVSVLAAAVDVLVHA